MKEHLLVFSDLGDIIEHSKLVNQVPETKGREKYNSWNYYYDGLKIGNNSYNFEFEVVIMFNGENHYRVQKLEKINNKKSRSFHWEYQCRHLTSYRNICFFCK